MKCGSITPSEMAMRVVKLLMPFVRNGFRLYPVAVGPVRVSFGSKYVFLGKRDVFLMNYYHS